VTGELAEAEWRARKARHADRLRTHCVSRAERTSRRQSDPVDDFLFEYYGFPPARLLRWSPGPDVVMRGAGPDELEWGRRFATVDGGLVLPAASFPRRRSSFLHWAVNYLRRIADRPMALGCFGLHEWAMVYRQPDVRHQGTPLRLSPAAIAKVVESSDLRCTHFDAYRFFSQAAAPRNRVALTRHDTEQYDQPGCVHVTMDLFKYAGKLAPWCPGELIADAFHLARAARIVDMRASPYDLRGCGLGAITIETRAGRDEYVALQKDLAAQAAPLRGQLIGVYEHLVAAAGDG
jgi:hypothetical protein